LDLHLHPKWQRTIIESLRSAFPRLQFICTTHSPFLIQSQRLGNLIQLDKEGDEEAAAEEFHRQSIEDIVEDVQGVELPQKSKRYLDMMEAAESYYRRLHEVADEADTELLSLKKRLDELTIPFGDDAAFAALLKYERGTVAASKAETT
jgi:predicted ATP-binding protein involved in virulence